MEPKIGTTAHTTNRPYITSELKDLRVIGGGGNSIHSLRLLGYFR